MGLIVVVLDVVKGAHGLFSTLLDVEALLDIEDGACDEFLLPTVGFMNSAGPLDRDTAPDSQTVQSI